jgi:hypothetical protein
MPYHLPSLHLACLGKGSFKFLLIWLPVFRIRIGFHADPAPAFYLNVDPDPGSQTNADPDPGKTLPS